MRATTLLAVMSVVVAGCTSGPLESSVGFPETRAPYVSRKSENTTVIVFVHGVLGDARSSWTNATTGAYWPQLLLQHNDEAFQAVDVYVHEYRSPLLDNAYSIDELAENLRLMLFRDGVFDDPHKHVVFVAHSMGGLVVRSFLVKYASVAGKVRMVYFFGTPTTGSAVANIASLVSRNPQYRMMRGVVRNAARAISRFRCAPASSIRSS